MPRYFVSPIEKPEIEPFEITAELRTQLQYFTTGETRDPKKPNEYFFPLLRTRELLEDGVFYMVSPLDSQNKSEIEITLEQEIFLEWIVEKEVENIRVEEA